MTIILMMEIVKSIIYVKCTLLPLTAICNLSNLATSEAAAQSSTIYISRKRLLLLQNTLELNESGAKRNKKQHL